MKNTLNDKKQIWIIAYAFAPNKRVGALRASYWHKHISDSINADVTVFTAEEHAVGPNIHVVPKSGLSIMSRLIQDEGVVWRSNLKKVFESQYFDRPDVIIITGGPFMHFSLTKWLKQRYQTKVILDYRDPFAVNPGFDNSGLKVMIKRFFEKRFNREADALVTVNDYCGKLVEFFDTKPNAIVQNGYDESVEVNFTNPVLDSNLNLVYAGKFYFDPAPIQKAVEESECRLTYIGPDEQQFHLSSKAIESKGFVPYPEAIRAIASADIGIIQTYGHEFQSTTKIFDYVRCGRVILIISNDKIEEGSIHDELIHYPNVFWAKNDSESIKVALDNIKKHEYLKPPANFGEKYSRKFQLTKLIELLKEIGL